MNSSVTEWIEKADDAMSKVSGGLNIPGLKI